MGSDPKMSVAEFLKDALKRPDGILAYAVSAFCLGLLLVAVLTKAQFTDVALLQRARDDAVVLIVMPLIMLGAYAWDISDTRSPGRTWINIAFILGISAIFLRHIFGW